MSKKKDWTERSAEDFVFSIASDFMDKVLEKMEQEDITQTELAKRLGVSPGSVSQTINDPGNITLRRIVEYARSLGLKPALWAYEDGDPDNYNGPISGELFDLCWQKCGHPKDMWDFETVNSGETPPYFIVEETTYGDMKSLTLGDPRATIKPIMTGTGVVGSIPYASELGLLDYRRIENAQNEANYVQT